MKIKRTIIAVLMAAMLATGIFGTATAAFAATAGWEYTNNAWHYRNADGSLVKGWLTIDGCTYYFDNKGNMVTGRKLITSDYYYFLENGAMKTGWVSDGGEWYYYESSGKGASGWKWLLNNWYYFTQGKMRTGYATIDGDAYYFGENGTETGWKVIKGKTHYFDPSTYKEVTGFAKIGGYWYFFDSAGVMNTGWVYSHKYYMNENGQMVFGWQKIGGKWYYFGSSGLVATGWQKIDGYWYYFSEAGSVTYSTTISLDGICYKFDENGRCVKYYIDYSQAEAGSYYGYLSIPDVGLSRYLLHGTNNSGQWIIDNTGYGVYLFGEVSLIGDHRNKGFYLLDYVGTGTIAWLTLANGTTLKLQCIATGYGYRTDSGVYDWNQTKSNDWNCSFGIYTCSESGSSRPRVTKWNIVG